MPKEVIPLDLNFKIELANIAWFKMGLYIPVPGLLLILGATILIRRRRQ